MVKCKITGGKWLWFTLLSPYLHAVAERWLFSCWDFCFRCFLSTMVFVGVNLKLCVDRFTITVKKNYRRVPYHNWTHGFAVANMMYCIIKHNPDVFKTIEVVIPFLGTTFCLQVQDVEAFVFPVFSLVSAVFLLRLGERVWRVQTTVDLNNGDDHTGWTGIRMSGLRPWAEIGTCHVCKGVPLWISRWSLGFGKMRLVLVCKYYKGGRCKIFSEFGLAVTKIVSFALRSCVHARSQLVPIQSKPISAPFVDVLSWNIMACNANFCIDPPVRPGVSNSHHVPDAMGDMLDTSSVLGLTRIGMLSAKFGPKIVVY